MWIHYQNTLINLSLIRKIYYDVEKRTLSFIDNYTTVLTIKLNYHFRINQMDSFIQDFYDSLYDRLYNGVKAFDLDIYIKTFLKEFKNQKD